MFYYDYGPVLSYNKFLNFIEGNRGCGKTYGAKKLCIDDFIKRGNQFFYVRRYKGELDDIKTFFDDIAEIYPERKFTVKGGNKGGEFQMDGVTIGFYKPLSTSLYLKSVPFPKVRTIVFDEYVIDKGNVRYLKNEAELFLELCSTILRLRNGRVLMLSNAISAVNPYFLYLNILPEYKKQYTIMDDIIIERVENEAYKEAARNTALGRITKGLRYSEYAVENKYLRDNDDFVSLRPLKGKYYCTLKYKGRNYGIISDTDNGRLWVSKSYDKSCKLKWAVTKEDHSPNTSLLRAISRSSVIKYIRICYEESAIFYEDIVVKNQFYEILSLLFTYK